MSRRQNKSFFQQHMNDNTTWLRVVAFLFSASSATLNGRAISHGYIFLTVSFAWRTTDWAKEGLQHKTQLVLSSLIQYEKIITPNRLNTLRETIIWYLLTTVIYKHRKSSGEEKVLQRDLHVILTKRTLLQRTWRPWRNDDCTVEWRLASLAPWMAGFYSETDINVSQARHSDETIWKLLHVPSDR